MRQQFLKYGSLWVQLVERQFRDQQHDEHLMELLASNQEDTAWSAELTYLTDREHNLIFLPLRKLAIEYDGDSIIISGRKKKVLSNRDAIKFLYNIDNNKCKADDWDFNL